MANQHPQGCTVNEALARALSDCGLGTMFGLLGDANLFMARHYVDDFSGRFVAATHEAGAVLMGLGHSLATGSPGLVSVTHGPGLTNALTALVDGVKARIPLLLLCGDTPAAAPDHFQNVSQRDFVLATGAAFVQLRAPETVLDDLLLALRTALFERKPVVMNIPAEFGWEEVDYRPVKLPSGPHRQFSTVGEELENAVGIIAAARSPIVLGGRGAMTAVDEAALIALAERTGALLATTLKGKGLFCEDPYNIGIFGGLSTPLGNELILASDCIIAFGASLNRWTTSQGSLLEGKRVIQCNLEAADLGAGIAPDAVLLGDPASVVADLMHWLDAAEIPPSGFRNEEIRERIDASDPFQGLADTATANTVDLTRSLLRLNDVIARDRIVVTDVGRFVGQAWKALSVASAGAFIHTVNFGSIGLAPGYAMGAAVASPQRPTVLVVGDGGFMLGGVSEFHTAVREQLDLIVIVCNDASYGAEHVQYADRGLDPRLALFDWPEFAAVAKVMGGHGVSVREPAELEAACEAIRDGRRPLLIDLKLHPGTMLPLDY
ncbi:MAG: thiamine pyrophosphate-binding protein [Pseudohaliea sp.]